MDSETNENGAGSGSVPSKEVGSDPKDSNTDIAGKVSGLVRSDHMSYCSFSISISFTPSFSSNVFFVDRIASLLLVLESVGSAAFS